jgi:hypothetical protein
MNAFAGYYDFYNGADARQDELNPCREMVFAASERGVAALRAGSWIH